MARSSAKTAAKTKSLQPWRTVATGFAFGALTYGGVISLLHLQLNRGLSVTDTLATFGLLSLLYGLLTACCCGAGLGVRQALDALGRTRRKTEKDPESRHLLPGLSLGLIAFNGLFWCLFVLYGRTYDQTWPFQWESFPGMAAYLLALGLTVATLTTLASRWLARRLSGLNRPLVIAGCLTALWTLIHITLTLTGPAAQSRSADTKADQARIVTASRSFGTALIGLDGLDPEVVESLIAAGQLPTFKKLRDEGTWGELETLPDANSAVIWASIYTGMRPSEHGIHDFYRIHLPGVSQGLFPVHRTLFKELCDLLARVGLSSQSLVTRGDLYRPLLWEISDRAGRTTGLMDGYLYSFPVQPTVTDGSWMIAYGADGLTRQVRSGDLDNSDLELFLSPAELFPELQDLLDKPDFKWQSASSLRLLETRGSPQFLNLYTHEPDTVQHQKWVEYRPERYPAFYPGRPTDLALADTAIAEMHRQFDAYLAKLLEILEPGTPVVIVSDHGHVATPVHKLQTQHRHGPAGVFLASGGPFRAGYTIAQSHVYDIAPTILYLLGLPVAQDAAGQVLEEALRDEFVSANPINTVPTYNWLEADRKDATRGRELDKEEIEKLKRLGYL